MRRGANDGGDGMAVALAIEATVTTAAAATGAEAIIAPLY